MAAAFLLEQGRSNRPSMEFAREVEENGIKFNVENATEDIINGVFCTYEPPTSKLDQYKAAKAVRKNPKKFDSRPSVPKSILKWKFKKNKKKKEKPAKVGISDARSTTPSIETRDDIDGADENASVVVYDKKSVTWRDERSQKDRTEMEKTVVGITSKYCGGACNQGEGIAEIMSSPTGRAAQKFFGEASSSIFGTKTDGSASDELVSKEKDDEQNEREKKILYDDLGNPIREDDVQSTSSSYLQSTPQATIEAAPTPTPVTPTSRSTANDPKNGHQNLFCSNIPFMDTVIEGIGIAGVVAASAAVAAGVPENLCSPYKMKKTNSTPVNNTSSNNLIVRSPKTAEQAQISEELRQAQESLGIYEPESYDQPSETSETFKKKRQSTPRHVPGSQNLDEDEDEDESHRDPPESTRSAAANNMSSQRSYATSDITMGNTTIKHFDGDISLFDETLGKEEESSFKVKTNKFSSMVEELKSVQKEKGLEGSSQHKDMKSPSASNGVPASVQSLRQGFEKSPRKKSVVTNSYVNSLKSPSNQRFKGDPSPRAGTVASLAKQFESPRSNAGRSFVRPTTTTPTTPTSVRKGIDPTVRQSIDPDESLNNYGTVHLLPPTPRRKQKTEEPPSFKPIGGELPPTPRRKFESRMQDWNNNNNNDAEGTKTETVVSVNTDAEIREEASTILDAGHRWKPRPSFKGRLVPKSLLRGPETVEDESEDIANAPEARQEKDDGETNDDAKEDKTKKDKKKKRKQKFASKFKKSMEKALEPVLTATRKVESQRISQDKN